jgi:putative nucleotidyltransferase with HDIG domain
MISQQHVIEKLSSFRTLPVVANRLLAVINNPESDASDVARVISLDLALTANVLKAANSAYYGFSRPVSSLTEATFRLGVNWVAQMAVSSLVYGNVNRPAAGYGQSARDIWRHSAAVATTSENLCRLLHLKGSNAIFTAALIHDIGKLAIEEFVAEHLPEIRARLEHDHESFEQAEREVLGYDHAELGAMVAERWNFPQELVQAVRWHHDPNRAEADRQAVDVIHVADALCIMQGIGIGHDGLSYRPCADSLQRLNVTGSVIEAATSQMLDSLAEIESIFSEAPAPAGVGR